MQHLNGLARLVRAQVGLGQQLTRQQQPRGALEGACQKGFCLGITLESVVGRTRQFKHPWVVRHRLEQPVGDLTRGLVVLVRESELGFEEQRVGVVGYRLLQLVELRLGLVQLALPGQDRDDRGMRAHRLGVRGQNLAKALQCTCLVFLAMQEHLAPQDAGALVVGFLLQGLAQQDERAIEVALGRFQPRLEHRGGYVSGNRSHGRIDGQAGLAQVGAQQVGGGQRGRQVGGGSGILELREAVLRDQLGLFAHHHHGARDGRDHILIRHLEFLRLAQLHHGRNGIAAFE